MGDGDNLTGVRITPLAKILGSKGIVMHIMAKDASGYCGFGEAYFSTVEKGAIKGWKLHRELVANLVVPVGAVRFALYDGREDSATRGRFQTVRLSADDYGRLTLPAQIWFGFRGLEDGLNLVLNIASIPHSDGEVQSLPLQNDVIPPYEF